MQLYDEYSNARKKLLAYFGISDEDNTSDKFLSEENCLSINDARRFYWSTNGTNAIFSESRDGISNTDDDGVREFHLIDEWEAVDSCLLLLEDREVAPYLRSLVVVDAGKKITHGK
jgi:hypothetical protein